MARQVKVMQGTYTSHGKALHLVKAKQGKARTEARHLS
jgi:hypothetical protein